MIDYDQDFEQIGNSNLTTSTSLPGFDRIAAFASFQATQLQSAAGAGSCADHAGGSGLHNNNRSDTILQPFSITSVNSLLNTPELRAGLEGVRSGIDRLRTGVEEIGARTARAGIQTVAEAAAGLLTIPLIPGYDMEHDTDEDSDEDPADGAEDCVDDHDNSDDGTEDCMDDHDSPDDGTEDCIDDHVRPHDVAETPADRIDETLRPRPLRNGETDRHNFDAEYGGRRVSMRSDRDNPNNLSFWNGTDRYTSNDGGTSWTSPDTSPEASLRSINRDENGNIVMVNNSGVRTEIQPDGTNTRSIRTSSGETVSITQSRDLTTVSDQTGTWMSNDGRNFWNEDGETWSGSINLDDTGNYWVQRDGDETMTLEGRSREGDVRRAQEQQIDQRTRQIESRFNVQIARPGTYYDNPDGSHMTRSRRPTSDELDVLERSLARDRSNPIGNLLIRFIQDDAVSRLGPANRYVPGENRIDLYNGSPTSPRSDRWDLEDRFERQLTEHLRNSTRNPRR